MQKMRLSHPFLCYLLFFTDHFFAFTTTSLRPRIEPLFALPEKVPNEFSRLVEPERILKTKSTIFQQEIKAEDDECDALAKRFDLPALALLEADVILKNEKSSDRGIEVDGMVRTRVTRTCVRTNEDFEQELEIPIFAIVRPVVPISTVSAPDEDLPPEVLAYMDTLKKKKSKTQEREINNVGMLELQRMLERDISEEDDVLMEDESIYSTMSQLDLGELIAQLFWLSLDPYPKKPGTDPVEYSVTSK